MTVYIPPELMLQAYTVVGSAMDFQAAIKRMRYLATKPPKPYLAIDQKLREDYAEAAVRELRRRLDSLVDGFLGGLVEENGWVRCLLSGPLPRLTIVAFVAQPPQVTIPKLWRVPLKPGSYINTSFIPVRLKSGLMHRPLLARAAFSTFSFNFRMLLRRGLIASRYPDLHQAYKSFLEKNRAKATSERHAERLAVRDTFRILVGNAWLAWVYMASEEGLIELADAPLPYHLAKEPELHLPYMLDPIKTYPTCPARYTWRGLVEAHARR